MSLNTDLAALFATMADIMDIKGENTFKVLAFRKVGRILADLSFDVRDCIKNNTLCEIEGIGASSQRIIEEFATTGRSSDFDSLSQSVPATLLPLLQVEGLGPKTISLLWKERKITNADQLKAALEDGSLKGIKTIGDKKLASIKQGLENRAKSAGRIGIGHALPVAQMFVEEIRKFPGVAHAQYAGSLRRGRETIGDLDIIASVKDPKNGQKIADAFVALPAVARVIGAGPSKSSIVTASGLQVDLRIIPEENFGAAILYFTGSKDHNVKIRGLALKQKMTLNEWGLYKLAEYEKAEKKVAEAPPIKPVASRTEEEIYARLGLDFISPELREDRGEIDLALNHKLPKLITQKDLRGDLHTHTTASDGKNSILEMAEAAKALGYEYLAITDHSKSQVIANGLTPEKLLKHIAEIRKAQDKIKGITLLAGSEVDILVDGRLDYEEAILKELDIVVASPHASLKQDAAKANERMKRAIETRYVNIIGHPTGRLIGGREGLPLDFPPLFKLASSTGTAMEINAGYPRLDLDEFNSRSAAEAGVTISIDTDAHSTAELSEIQFGLTVARRAALSASHVLNCQPLKDLRAFLARKR